MRLMAKKMSAFLTGHSLISQLEERRELIRKGEEKKV